MLYSRLTRWFCDRICAGPVRVYKVLKQQCLPVAFRRVSFRVVFDITSDRRLNSKLILTDLKRFVSLKIQSNRPLSQSHRLGVNRRCVWFRVASQCDTEADKVLLPYPCPTENSERVWPVWLTTAAQHWLGLLLCLLTMLCAHT